MTTTSEATNGITVVKNPGHTEFGSDLLNELAEVCKAAYHTTAKKEATPVPGAKGEIVTALVIHLVGAAIFEGLKLAAKRLENHPFYDSLISLDINGRAVSLQDLIAKTKD